MFWKFKPCQLYLMVDFKKVFQSSKAEIYPQFTLSSAFLERYVPKEQDRAVFQQPNSKKNNSQYDEYSGFEVPMSDQ